MKKLHYSIVIDAPKQTVWHTMLDDKPYRDWSAAFSPGSHYVGSWEKGRKIQFLGPDENGKLGGMTSEIAENRPYEFVSIHHLGMVSDGVEDTQSEKVKEWAGYENYTFQEQDGKTTLLVDVDTADDFAEMMNDLWPKALGRLKELAEGK
jgi:uncharacterized protein YndB with AHSA1/START domain